MKLKRAALLSLWVVVAMLAGAPPALAASHGGQGLYGPTSATTVTYTMFFLIAFFPAIIVVFSLIQAYLDHRKHARMDAVKHRAAAPQWKGGW